MDFMSLFYIALWLILAIICFVYSKTVSKCLFPAGFYFTFVFVWRIIELFLPDDAFIKNAFNLIFTIVSVIALIIILVMYFKSKKENNK